MNITSAVDGYSRVTELEAWGGTGNYSYDSAGSVTSDGAHTYQYDAENRIVNVDGGTTATYAFDLSNQRYKKVTGGATTHCIWQGSQVIAEHNSITGAVIVDYVYSGSRMIAKVASGTTQYFLSDRLSAKSGLDFAINRGYSSAVGRFLSADPYRPSGYIVDPQSWNRYSYTRNNPLNRIDRLGTGR